MASLDMASFAAALKTLYQNQRVEDLTYKDHPFFAMLKKQEDFFGENYPLPLQYANPQGRSATFTTAQNNAVSSKHKKFLLTRVSDHAVITIDQETIEASENKAGAFIEARKVEIDSMLQNLISHSLSPGLFRDASGYLGQVSVEPNETASTFVVQLKDPNDIVNFEPGMVLNIHSAKTGGSQRSSDGSDVSWPIAAIDRVDGKLTLTGTYSSSGTIEANDYIFIEGDRGNKIAGLDSWLPETAPSGGDNFFNVDRSVDPVRLAGVRFDGSNLPIEEALIKGLALAAREGAAPSVALMNPMKVAELVTALGSKATYDMVKADKRADISFEAVVVRGPRGIVKVVADASCPTNAAFCLDMDTWVLKSLYKVPRINDLDGKQSQRQANADGIEIRAVYRAQLGCTAPGRNLRIKLG